jgi:hypothetical protein
VAFLPQLVRPGVPATSQILVLTVVFAAMALACDACGPPPAAGCHGSSDDTESDSGFTASQRSHT